VVDLGEQEETVKLKDQVDYWKEQADDERARGERERHEIYVFRESLEVVRINSSPIVQSFIRHESVYGKGGQLPRTMPPHYELVLTPMWAS
jgi:hypothetical protein